MNLFAALRQRRQPAQGFGQTTAAPETDLHQTFILEPILTPSGLVDVGEDAPEVADLNLDFGDEGDFDEGFDLVDTDLPDGDDLSDGELEEISFIDNLAVEFQFESGYFTVGESGEVTIDYLFDGGGYEGELAIFSLEGMEDLAPGSEAFIQEAANRALSESEMGYIVISDQTEGARFSGELGETNKNAGDYLGAKTFQMKPGDKFGFMLVPNGEVSEVATNPAIGGAKTPLFSLVEANPGEDAQLGQIVDVTGDGNTFVFEDLRTDGRSDRDYNDLIFQVRGATGEAALMDNFVDPAKDWRSGDLGQALITYAEIPAGIDAMIYDFPAEDQPFVGVLDTGFSGNNPDLDYSRIQLGKDWVDGDNNPLLADGEGNEHGTHTLGLIAAEQGNNFGIDGMNDDAPLWVGRAIGSGQWHESLREFVDAAKESAQPNAVINLSLDLTQIDADGTVTTRYEFTPQEREAIEYARQNGVLMVVAAGNDGGVMSVLGQAAQEFDNILTVGAADGLTRAAYSSYGNGLGLLALGGTTENPILSLMADGLGTMAGTSVATAQVTGAVSQVWAANPQLNYRQVIEILQATATDLEAPGWDAETGAGLLNIVAAIQLAKRTEPVPYASAPLLNPNYWAGSGTFIPSERSVSGNNTSSGGGMNTPLNAGNFVNTITQNGVTINYYSNAYQVIQPHGQTAWYAIGSGYPVSGAIGASQTPLPFFRVQPDNGSVPKLHMGYPDQLLSPSSNSVPRLLPNYRTGETSPFVDSVYFADVTGDGKDDAIVVNNFGVTVRPSNGISFLPNQTWAPEPFFGSERTYFTDVTGDGKADAIAVNENGIFIKPSTGSSFASTEQWTTDGFFGEKGTFFADVTGDGKADAIAVNASGITVKTSNGSQFGSESVWTTQAFVGEKGTFFADVNGDGKADVLAVDGDGVKVRLSRGSGFDSQKSWTDIGYYGTIGTYFADVTGDGKADAIVVNDERINNRVTVRPSTGTAFSLNEEWTKNSYFGNLGTFFADVDGNSKSDAIVNNDARVGERIVIRRSSGSNFSPNEVWTDIGYFGNGGQGSLVQGSGPEVYFITGNQKRWIQNPQTLSNMRFNGISVQSISDNDLSSIPTGEALPSLNSALIQGTGPKVYLLVNGIRRHIPDPTTLSSMGLDGVPIQAVSDSDLRKFPKGNPLPAINKRLLQAPGKPAVFYMENGYRRHIPDQQTFIQMGFNANQIQSIDYDSLNDIPLASALPIAGNSGGNPGGNTGWQNPLDPGTYTIAPGNRYRTPQRSNHNGIDLSTWHSNPYVPVKAAKPGQIIEVGNHPNGWGIFIRIQHDNGLRTVYAHLSSVNVKKGDSVNGGQKIGNVGSTGNSDGPHLHFEVHVAPYRHPQDTRNPENYIQF